MNYSNMPSLLTLYLKRNAALISVSLACPCPFFLSYFFVHFIRGKKHIRSKALDSGVSLKYINSWLQDPLNY